MTLAQLLEDPALALIGFCLCVLFACAFIASLDWFAKRFAARRQARRRVRSARRANYLTADLSRSLDRAEASRARAHCDA